MRSTFLGLAAVVMGLALVTAPAQAAMVTYDMDLQQMGSDVAGAGTPNVAITSGEVVELTAQFTGEAIAMSDTGSEGFYFSLFTTGFTPTTAVSNASATLYGIDGVSTVTFALSPTAGMSNLLEFVATDFLTGDFTFDSFNVTFTMDSLSPSPKTYQFANLVVSDEASVVAVPEPEAYASFAIGAMVLGLGAFYSMRRKEELSVA